MALKIETFSKAKGGDCLFKALGHPAVAQAARDLTAALAAGGPVAVYDPLGQLATFAELHDLSAVDVAGYYVQDIDRIGEQRFGQAARPVTELHGTKVKTVFVAAFDAQRLAAHVAHLVPPGATVMTLDAMRLPDTMLTDKRRYLTPLNFATNFAFFRDAGGLHTRLVTANYWSAYGAKSPRLWATLIDGSGLRLATWEDPLPGANATITVDSRAVRERFGLGEFTGQLFLQIVGAAGHDIVKYAVDIYSDETGDGSTLSCTHDANAWPSDLYAGLPAPRASERVVLWVQNSHPCPIPPGGVGLNLMGQSEVAWLKESVPPYGTHALDVATLLPHARWPEQLEIQAGKHFVRPRYEVTGPGGRTHIAHANVERQDLKPDPRLRDIGNLMGKGFILPAPILPTDRYRSIALPTPMATEQRTLPIAALIHDSSGQEVARHRFGTLQRRESVAIEAGEMLADAGAHLSSAYGHMELIYDFGEPGAEADGWLHALFRYEDVSSGHAAETSFGAHMFNTVLTYDGEPQSYAGPPPGLSTRLFLRLGQDGHDALCHLIYPASTPWHQSSETRLILHDRSGREAAVRDAAIPCGGSFLFRASELFDAAELRDAGQNAYILVRDTTCRLFGYHGLAQGQGRFSLDHMFGF
ncbi:MAG: hypothetical protein ACTS3R_17770 [Inquilinaceae bacterium]